MRRWILALGFIALLATGAGAEPGTYNFTEPPGGGTLAYSTIYWCTGTNCTNWQTDTRLRIPSDDGNGLDAKSIPFNLKLVEGTLPVILRIKVTSTNKDGNETSGTIATHTFTE